MLDVHPGNGILSIHLYHVRAWSVRALSGRTVRESGKNEKAGSRGTFLLWPSDTLATIPPQSATLLLRFIAMHKPFTAFLFLVCSLVAGLVYALSAKPDLDTGTWHRVARAPTQRTEVAVATLGGQIYVAGGFAKAPSGSPAPFIVTPAFEAYDVARDRWTTKAPLPVGLHHAGIGVAGGKLYVIGGYQHHGAAASVYAYDPATDSWTERTPMPTARGALSVTEHDGTLYAIGGYDGTANSPAVEQYDPARNSWTSRAPLLTPRDHLAAVTANGQLYAIGGRVNGDYNRNLSVTERYDPATDRWTRVADLPTPRSGITAAMVDGHIYVFGGESGAGTFNQNEAYDPAHNAWQTMAPMPTSRHGLGSAMVQGQIYVIAGGPMPGASFSNLNEVFAPPVASSSSK